MGDDEPGLERIRGSGLPAMWIAGWITALAIVVAVALGGRPTEPGLSPAIGSAAPSADALGPTAVPTMPPSPRPLPTLGDDGLVGGQVYSSAQPGD